MSNKYSAEFISSKQITPDITEVSIKRPAGFVFRAGQYIQLGLAQLSYPDPTGASRVLSIASSPLDSEKLRVAFRDSGSGFKESLKSLEGGDEVIFEGPDGFFTLPEAFESPIVLIAGGIGITPYLSMLLGPSVMPMSVTLLYCHDDKQAPYLTQLQRLAKKNDNFELIDIAGRIDGQIIEDNVDNLSDNIWYVSGPSAMVEFVRNELYLLGVDSERVIHEEFTGYDGLGD